MIKKMALLALIAAISFFGCEEAVKEVTTTISGTVTNDGVPVVGAYVFALQGISIDDLLTLDIALSSGTKVLSESGSYVIPALNPGTFQIIAIEDVNENNMIDHDTDNIGIYGEVYMLEDIPIPMSLDDVTIVNKGDDIENIDIDVMFGFGFGSK